MRAEMAVLSGNAPGECLSAAAGVFASQLVLVLCWSRHGLQTGSSGHEREGGQLFGARVKMLPMGCSGAGAL